MRLRNGLHSLGLAALVWSLYSGSQALAEEPPAELFAIPGDKASCDGECCVNCCKTCNSILTWLDSQSENLWSGCWGDWTVIPGSDQGVELAAYLDSECPYVSNGGAPSGSSISWQPECGNFGCDQRGRLSFDSLPVVSEPQDEIQPGEPAEILLEIRDRMGFGPLMGTVYQPIDNTTQSNAKDAFVAEIRASETAGECLGAPCEATSEVVTWTPAAMAPAAKVAPSEELILLLRRVSRQMAESADQLEDCEMYFRADQLREVATELRLEARSAGGEWSLAPLGAVQRTTAPNPERDLQRENEELRAEVERLRESLRAQVPNAEAKFR
jgi:hypothetical protein